MEKPKKVGQEAVAAIVVMGVAGSGKTAVGEQLARTLGMRFIEGDSYHPPHNVALMSAGTPLTDDDRIHWLDAIGNEIANSSSRGESTITACSALKRIYRDRLRGFCADIIFLYLAIDPQTATNRVAARRNHFMPSSLVDSQFEALVSPEPDERQCLVDAREELETVVKAALTGLRSALPIQVAG